MKNRVHDLTTIVVGDKVILTGMGYDEKKVYTISKVEHDTNARFFAGNTLCTFVKFYFINRMGKEVMFYQGFGQPHGRDLRTEVYKV